MPRHCFHYFFLASAYNIFDKGSVVRVELFLVWPITSCKNRSEIQANLSKNSNPEILQIPMYPMFLSQVTMCCVCRKASPAAEADLLLVTLSFLERETPLSHLLMHFFSDLGSIRLCLPRMAASHLRLIKCLTASANMLFWSFCLLTFFQCVSGLVISTLCKDFIQDSSKPLELRPLEQFL